MRAINLVPAEERRGAGGAAGRSGGAAYVLLGLLAVLVALAASYGLQKRALGDKRAELAQVEARAGASEAKAAEAVDLHPDSPASAPPGVQTVTSLASSRFRLVARAARDPLGSSPRNVSLTTLQGTVAPASRSRAVGRADERPVAPRAGSPPSSWPAAPPTRTPWRAC
jgi:hypothetical protein